MNTPLSDIVNGLADKSNQVVLDASVSKVSDSEFQVSIGGGASFSIPHNWFFTLSVDADATYFQDQIVRSENTIEITLSFPGVTAVQLAPAALSLSTRLNWFWPQPLQSAIRNGTADVTDFKFSATPTTDWSLEGDFGYPQTLAISSYPTITIEVTGSNYDSIATTIAHSSSVQGTFLGIKLQGNSSSYSHDVKTNAASSSVTITMSPPLQGMGDAVNQNVAWVLGASNYFPGTGAKILASRFQAGLALRAKRYVKK